MTPLAQDVTDVIEALGNVSELMFLRPRTKMGADLRDEAVRQRRPQVDAIARLSAEAVRLVAEVDGLRAQNEKLTLVIQDLEDQILGLNELIGSDNC